MQNIEYCGLSLSCTQVKTFSFLPRKRLTESRRFAEKCTPALVRSFIYVWHPDALDAFDNYFGSTSVFSEHREAVMWTTNITITHWSIRPTSLSKEHLERFRENRNNGDFPPLSIAQLGSNKKQRKTFDHIRSTDIVEERSSSLVITGDPFGHLWICSIWSSLTDSEAISTSVNTLLLVLGQFIHQQACARCLAFLILLGHLCEKLAAEYDMILSRLDGIVGLGASFTSFPDNLVLSYSILGESPTRRSRVGHCRSC